MSAPPPPDSFGTARTGTLGLSTELAGLYTVGFWTAGYWVRPSVIAEARLGTPAALVTTIQTTLHSMVGLLGLDEAIGESTVVVGV